MAPLLICTQKMSSFQYPWRAAAAAASGSGDAGDEDEQRSVLVLASYPALLVLVILAAFVRYVWIALGMYCVLAFLLSCHCRRVPWPPGAATSEDEEQGNGRGGLSRSALAAIPAFRYGGTADGDVDGDGQCAVCLEAVQGGETVRRLPACAHLFHVGCIDMWLDSHQTCPVCRCHLEPQPKGGEKVAAPSAVTPEPPLPPV